MKKTRFHRKLFLPVFLLFAAALCIAFPRLQQAQDKPAAPQATNTRPFGADGNAAKPQPAGDGQFTQAPAVNLITNGGFESALTGWTVSPITGNAWFPWRSTTAESAHAIAGVSATSPRAGTQSAWSGFCCNTTINPEYIYQDVALPAGQTASINWSDRIQSNLTTYCTVPACGSNTFRVEILNPTTNIVMETLYTLVANGGANYNLGGGWSDRQASLSKYAGQTIRLRFATYYSSTMSSHANGPGLSEVDEVRIDSPSLIADDYGLTINDVTVSEPLNGTATATFTVSLVAASAAPISVNYTTTNGTATSGSDFATASGTLTFTPGQVSKTIPVTINSDTTAEIAEKFTVNLSGATGAIINDAIGDGIINPPNGIANSREIVFAENSNGNLDIYKAGLTLTSARTRLTTSAANDFAPEWSPDGSKIAFFSRRDGNDEIYVMNPDGTGQTRLTFNYSPVVSGDDSWPRWSPKGDKIAFSGNYRGNFDVYVVNANGTEQINLTENTAVDSTPAWSPDGSKIAFASDRAGDFEIYTMNAADGSNVTRLTIASGTDTFPSFTPDGAKIIFTSNRAGNSEIFSMNSDGTNQVNLTNNAAFDDDAKISPDGKKIIFHRNTNNAQEIMTMNLDGTGQTAVTSNAILDGYPSWRAVAKIQTRLPMQGGSAGQPVTIPVSMDDTGSQGITKFDFTVTFDPAVITPQTPAFNTAGSVVVNGLGWTVNADTSTPGQVRVTGVFIPEVAPDPEKPDAGGPNAPSAAGPLVNLLFNVVGATGTSTPLTFTNFFFNDVSEAGMNNGTVQVLGPTGSSVTVSGQVLTPFGLPPKRGATVTLTGLLGGARATTIDRRGRYQFPDVETGLTYILTVSAPGFSFTPPTQIITPVGDTGGLNFTAFNTP